MIITDQKEIAKKWENLRRSYRRHVNQKKAAKRSGSAADDIDDDEDEGDDLWDNMTFLDPYIKLNSTLTNIVSIYF